MDVIGNLEQIREARKTFEFVIVLVHGGLEDFHLPTPRMVKQYRFYAENGASAVVGHHSHCVSGYEVHKGTPIFYSLGNFLFTLPHIYSRWYKGLVLVLKIQSGQGISWELVPVAQAKRHFTLARMTGEPLESIRRDIAEYTRIIADEDAHAHAWKKFLGDHEGQYLNIFNPVNAVWNGKFRAALFMLRADRLFRRRAHYAEILNTMRCESHAEAAQGIIRRILD